MRLLPRGMSSSIACAWPAVVGICIELTRTPSSAAFNRPFVDLLDEVGVNAGRRPGILPRRREHLEARPTTLPASQTPAALVRPFRSTMPNPAASTSHLSPKRATARSDWLTVALDRRWTSGCQGDEAGKKSESGRRRRE